LNILLPHSITIETNVFPADFPAENLPQNSRGFCCLFSNLDEFTCR